MNIIEKLQGLHHQATEEKSHFYVGSVALEAVTTIFGLRDELKEAHEVVQIRDREIDRLLKQEALYLELLYTVESKFPGESRHQTARRYLPAAEACGHGGPSQTKATCETP